jgi:hypothetical protein
MKRLIRFMNGVWGRAGRVVLGLALIWYGLFTLGGIAGAIVAVAGLLPIALGLAGRCALELFVPAGAGKTAQRV